MTLLLLLPLSRFSRVRLCVTPWTAAYQAPPSLGFSRQEHWSRMPFPSPMQESEKWKWSHSVVSDSVRPHGLQPTRLLCPWDCPGKNTGVGSHFHLQGIFPTQGLNLGLLHCRQILFCWSTRKDQFLISCYIYRIKNSRSIEDYTVKEISVTEQTTCVIFSCVPLWCFKKYAQTHFYVCYVYVCFLSLLFKVNYWHSSFLFFMSAAAVAKSFQSCLTLCDPIDGSPPGSPIPMQIKTSQVCVFFSITCLRLRIFSKDLKPFVFSVNSLLM